MTLNGMARALLASVLALGGATSAWAGEPGYSGTIEGFGGITNADRPFDQDSTVFSGGVGGSVRLGVAGPVAAQVDAQLGGQRGDTDGAVALHLGAPLARGVYLGVYGDYEREA